jgi:pseudaminic acid synthase
MAMRKESHNFVSLFQEETFLVAEMSANHDKDLDQALALVDLAADSGWDAIKLQTYTADSLTLRSEHPSFHIESVWGHRTLYELYQEASMPMEFHEPLFKHARARGLIPFTSVYDPRDIDFCESLECEIYKIASFELTFDDLLLEVSNLGKPIILSTGMATFDEIEHALSVIAKGNSKEITLLHCCSAYPAPLAAANLAAIVRMRDQFKLPIGYSDHTEGSAASIAAAAMGAVCIEKHFTNDRTRKGPDHRFSAEAQDLVDIRAGIHALSVLKGDGRKYTTECEAENRIRGRRSAFAIRDLIPGEKLTKYDYRFVRPGVGIPANKTEFLDNKTIKTFVAAGDPIMIEDLS